MLIAHAGLRGHGTPSPPSGKGGIAPPNFDVRTSPELKANAVQRLGRGSSVDMLARVGRSNAAAARLRELLPDATVSLSPRTGGAHLVASPRGALTAPSTAGSRVIVGDFLRSHAGIYGLDIADVPTIRFKGESVSRSWGVRRRSSPGPKATTQRA